MCCFRRRGKNVQWEEEGKSTSVLLKESLPRCDISPGENSPGHTVFGNERKLYHELEQPQWY